MQVNFKCSITKISFKQISGISKVYVCVHTRRSLEAETLADTRVALHSGKNE